MTAATKDFEDLLAYYHKTGVLDLDMLDRIRYYCMMYDLDRAPQC